MFSLEHINVKAALKALPDICAFLPSNFCFSTGFTTGFATVFL